jgi:hypothetical protein
MWVTGGVLEPDLQRDDEHAEQDAEENVSGEPVADWLELMAE